MSVRYNACVLVGAYMHAGCGWQCTQKQQHTLALSHHTPVNAAAARRDWSQRCRKTKVVSRQGRQFFVRSQIGNDPLAILRGADGCRFAMYEVAHVVGPV